MRSDRSALTALARALASSPGWPEAAEVRFVVRDSPSPVLGIAGRQGLIEPARLNAQARACERAVGRVRHVGHRSVERAVEELARALVERFGIDAVRGFRYAGIPRGGLIVLGLLAAALDVPADQIGTTAAREGEPLVVVDDCSLSGARFAAFLAACPAPSVLFAHLYSHPALRAAIEAREPRVLACIASRDLHDYGPERLPGTWEEARERWHQRLGASRYWLGDCERIAFPWNEPDRLVWNPAAGEVELGWKLIPPELALKQRLRLQSTLPPRIQIQPRGRGPWHPSSEVLFTWSRGATVVHRLDTGALYNLPGTAHAFWWALLREGTPEAAFRRLRSRYHVTETTLQSDFAGFLEALRTRGLAAGGPDS